MNHLNRKKTGIHNNTLILRCALALFILVYPCLTGNLASAQNVAEPAPPKAASNIETPPGMSKIGGLPRVVYGFDREFPPFSYEKPGGEPTGFEVELLQMIFQDKAKLFYQPLNWDLVQLELAAGKIQVTSGMVKTPARAKLFNFSQRPSFRTSICIFTKVYSRIPNLTFLRGQPVAVEKGSYQQRLLEDFGGINIKIHAKKTDALKALANDDVAAYCGPRESTYFMLKKLNIGAVTTSATPLGFTDMHFAVSKDRPDVLRFINDGMEAIIKNGDYDRLYRRWFVQELNQAEVKAMLEAARKASLPAYAPHSGISMGAAVLTATGKIYTGCNVENAVPALSVSALRAALVRAVSEGELEIRAAVAVDYNGNIMTPTNDDYQSFYEFGRGILFVFEPEKGRHTSNTVAELFANPVQSKPIDLNIE